MREMKDSGMPWIGKIPKNWGTSPIKYICKPNSIKIGPFGSALANKTFANEKYNVYGQANLVSGNFSATKNTVTKKTFNDLRNYEVLPDDICVSMMGTIGKCRIVPLGIKQGIMDSHLIKLRVKNEVILPEFFLYVYDKDLGGVCFKQMQYEKTGSIMDGLNTSIVKRLYVTLPPIKEQHRITDYLDSKCAKIDSVRKNVESEIEALKQYKQSVITEAVTKGLDKDVEMKDSGSQYWGEIPQSWNIVDIKYLFQIMKRIAGREGYDVLSITQHGIKVRDVTIIKGQLANDYSNYQLLYPGEFAMNHMDLLTGWVDLSDKFGVTSPDYRVFRLRDTVHNSCRYYKYVMQVCYMCRIFYSLGSGVANLGRWRLQTPAFNNFKVPVPSYEEQEAIANYLDNKVAKIDSIIQNKQELLANLDTYKKSLIYEYVTGKKEVPAV